MNRDLSKLFEELIGEEIILRGTPGYLSEMSIIITKSLTPSLKDISVLVNYERYIREIDLWLDYRTGTNHSLDGIKTINSKSYWKSLDDSIFNRIVPLVISNKEEEFFLEELIKNILFTTGNLQELFLNVSIGYILYLIVNSIDNKLDRLKNIIINFSQKEFLLKYGRYYRVDKETYPNRYEIDFEKEKIDLISYLNGVPFDKYKPIGELFKVIGGENPGGYINSVVYSYLFGREGSPSLNKFYLDMGSYLVNLRESKIPPEALEIKDYILPDIFSFNQGDNFYHSLLKECKIVKKESKNNIIKSLVQTKSGVYLFNKKI